MKAWSTFLSKNKWMREDKRAAKAEMKMFPLSQNHSRPLELKYYQSRSGLRASNADLENIEGIRRMQDGVSCKTLVNTTQASTHV